MPFKIGSISGDNVKVGSTQIAKIMLGATKIWENWIPWATSYMTQDERDYQNTKQISYNIPVNHRVESVTGMGTRDSVGSEIGYVTITIFATYNGVEHQVAQGGPSLGYGAKTWVNSEGYDVTRIRIRNTGSTLPANVGYSISGYQKGN